MKALLLVLASAMLAVGCAAPSIKSSDFGQVSVQDGQTIEAVAYGETESAAVGKALNAATLYCQEARLGQGIDAASRSVEYLDDMPENPVKATVIATCSLKAE